MIAIVQVYGTMLLIALGRTLLMTLLALIFAMIIRSEERRVGKECL